MCASRSQQTQRTDASGGPSRLIITIDGPAGTGKSSVARELAERLGLDFLDTGAMYRAATALALERGIDPSDGPAIAEMLNEACIRFDWSKRPPELQAFGKSIMHILRTPEVDACVSPISKLPEVRSVLVETQRAIANDHPRLVTEGRDQGSVVFPDADVKIYLDADLGIRAARRARQLGVSTDEDALASIEKELRERDERDSTRSMGPLTCPPDAIVVDTTTYDQDAVVGRLVQIVTDQLPTHFPRGTPT